MKHIFLRIHAPLNLKYTIDKKECISFGNAYINRLVNIEHESSTDTDIFNVSKKRSIFKGGQFHKIPSDEEGLLLG